jgi:tetratricopeptide (TPR) repeat protein
MRERIEGALGRDLPRAERVTLLRLRAELGPDDEEAAIADLEAAHRLDPRGVAHQLADALDARRTRSPDRDVLLRFVDLAIDLNDPDRARDALAASIDHTPADPVLVAKAAELEAFAGHWDAAVQLCERLVELTAGADRIRAALLLAGACDRAGYPNDARGVLEQVFAEDRRHAEVRDHLLRIYEHTGAHRELAGLHLDEAANAEDASERFTALRRAGSLLLESAGDPAAAIEPLEAARELKPKDHDVAMLLADAYIRSGKLQEAADFLDAAIQAQKGRRTREASMMQHRMAQIARAVGDQGNELAWLNAAFESDAQNGDAAAALADVATELGQLDVAVKALKAITLMKTPKPLSRAMAYLRQAMIAQHQGDLRKASMLAKKAQSEDPSLADAQTFLSGLGG